MINMHFIHVTLFFYLVPMTCVHVRNDVIQITDEASDITKIEKLMSHSNVMKSGGMAEKRKGFYEPGQRSYRSIEPNRDAGSAGVIWDQLSSTVGKLARETEKT